MGHHKEADDTVFQLNYFKRKIGNTHLPILLLEVLIAQRKVLSEPNEPWKDTQSGY